jgi:beta-galactosidase
MSTDILPLLNVPAGESKVIRINLDRLDVRPNSEYFIIFRVRQREGKNLIPAGHVIAYEQFRLPFVSLVPATTLLADSLTYNLESGKHVVAGKDFSIGFDNRGWLCSYVLEGKEMLEDCLRPNFWRAPVDNDYGNRMPARSAVWKTAADSMRLISFQVKQPSSQVVEIRTRYEILPVGGRWDATYKVFSDGRIDIENVFSATDRSLPEIPRIGMRMRMNPDLANMNYYGRGPWENYIDRKSSALISLYTDNAFEQQSLYVRPQEHSYKTGIRWFALFSDEGKGLMAAGHPVFSGSALSCAMEDLDDGERKDQRHIVDVADRNFIEWSIDFRQMGVGGDNSWGARPLDRYLIHAGTYRYGFSLLPLRSDAVFPDNVLRAMSIALQP